MSWDRLLRQLNLENKSEFDFVVDGEEIRHTGAVGGRERVRGLRNRIEELIAGSQTSQGLVAELDDWIAEIQDVINELDEFDDRAAAERFQNAFGAIGDALIAMADSLDAAVEYTALLGPLAVLETAVADFDRLLSSETAAEAPRPASDGHLN